MCKKHTESEFETTIVEQTGKLGWLEGNHEDYDHIL